MYPTKRPRNVYKGQFKSKTEYVTRRFGIDDCHVGKLYMRRLRLPTADDAQNRHTRLNDIILKGFKLDFRIFGEHSPLNEATPDQTRPAPRTFGFMGPCVCHVALIQFDEAKGTGVFDADGKDNLTETLATELVGEWWSSHEGTSGSSDNSRPFNQLNGTEPNAASAFTKWQTYWLTGKINPNHSAGFRILAREKMYVQQILQNGAGGPGQKTWGMFHKYYAINSPIYLHNNEEENWKHPIYICMWITPLNPNFLENFPNPPSTQANQFEVDCRYDCYFQEDTS